MAAAAAGKSTHCGNEIKTQFCTKEGLYKALKLSDYSKPIRLANNTPNNVPVRLSFVTIKGSADEECEDKIVFNVGRDMFLYNFRGINKVIIHYDSIYLSLFNFTFHFNLCIAILPRKNWKGSKQSQAKKLAKV